MTWDPEVAYDALPHLPPRAELETRAVLKATIDARDALARLDAAARRLPNAAVVINAIPLLEAQASSEIENIVTTTDELFAAQAGSTAESPAAREALRYRGALRAGFDEIGARPLTSNTAVSICSMIRGHDVSVRRTAVYIGDPITQKRIYTPPLSATALASLLDNWSNFVNESPDLDPLVRMAVAHYQFEAIHPFTDGNGRTGRILNVLILCDAGLLHLPLLYLSRYIIETKDEYYRLLAAVTSSNAWEEWLLYLIESVRSTSIRTLQLVDRIMEIEAELTAVARATFGSPNSDLIAALMEQPYARTHDVMARCGVSRPTATKWLRELVAAGALKDIKSGRQVLYINTHMMEALRTA